MKTNGYMRTLEPQGPAQVPMPVVIGIFVLMFAVGASGAYYFTKKSASPLNSSSPTAVQTDKASGVVDKSTFKDSATGIMKDGGIDGEGSFHLERPGGVSQNVYLTSSTVDLSKFIGKQVTVWGQTMQARTAGWLMDVGLVETK